MSQVVPPCLTYLPDDLRALNHGRPPPRPVRKLLFTLRLWRPAYHRRVCRRTLSSKPAASHTNVNTPATRSADPSTAIGWLNAQSLTNKAAAVNAVIADHSLDILALTETWHSASDDVRLRLATPADYAVVDNARSSGRGGGVAVIYRRHFKCSRIPLPSCASFEAVCVRLTTPGGPIVLLTVYRPGSARPLASFYDELSSVLEVLVTFSCPVLVGGDINIHVEDGADADARRLHELLVSFDMVQHVTGPTHRCGGTLDLVMTFSSAQLDEVSVDPAGIISDHSLVRCRLPMSVGRAPAIERLVTAWRRVDRDELRRALENSRLCQPVAADADVDELVETYETVLRDIADHLAPTYTLRRPANRRAPWFDDDCRDARRECRRRERHYRRTHDVTDRRHWVDAARRRFQLYRSKKETYWTSRLERDGRAPPLLWRSLSSVLGRDRDTTGATGHTAEGFAAFFTRRVDEIRADTAAAPPPDVVDTAPVPWSSFQPCTEADVRRIIMSSPVKSCSLDQIPTFLLREHVDLFTPFVTAIVNASLSQGRLPDSQKHAIVLPLLKKSGLDTADMANFRPVSNLSFLSKVIERVVARQVNSYLMENGLLPRCQSAYRRHHSTETAMLRVLSDALTAADNRQVTLLGMLDLSAAFDCVDHLILLQRLERNFGLTGAVLQWMTSFLTGRTQQVIYDGRLSAIQQVRFGVPQGSVLGPLLFTIYTTEVSKIVINHGCQVHLYADDCQVYVSVPVDAVSSATTRLSQCIADVAEWFSMNRLRLNPAKTQVIWLGSKQLVDKVDIVDVPVMSTTVRTADSARDLGVILDSYLTMAPHVSTVCRAAYYQLRQLRPLMRSLSFDAAKLLVQAFISTRLDYCNSLMYGISDNLNRRLQAVQNAAARLITSTRRCEHITPVLQQLHWLPVRQRVHFKLAVLAYKALHDRLPSYLAEDCQLVAVTGRRRLRSSDIDTCQVRRTNTRFGDRSFAAAGPRTWNSLPIQLRDSELSLEQFRRSLKTHLYKHIFGH